jgi:glycosyltransferase involved in cell wall biosynthesis
MRVCVVYDCLYPYTVGGAERWYRNLAERLAREGHDVTYVTLRQWDRDETPELAGDRAGESTGKQTPEPAGEPAGEPGSGRVRVVSVGPRMSLYTRDGRRRILPPLVFGIGVLGHLVRRGRRYDAVHTCSFPYFSLLAAALSRPLGRYELTVDWFEVWSHVYWHEYLGGVGGRIGAGVQRVCAHVRQRAFCYSRLHARRLREQGLRGEATVLRGLYAGALEPAADDARGRADMVLFAGRLIPEKRAPLAVAAIGDAAASIAGLTGVLLGDGPEREAVARAIAGLGLEGIVSMRGFTSAETVDEEMRRAMCLLLASSREGYGLVVVEAAARGTPSIVVAGPDNAAVELIEEGANGFVCASANPREIAAAIVRVHAAGPRLRHSTARWFARHAHELSLESSLRTVLASYGAGGPGGGESGMGPGGAASGAKPIAEPGGEASAEPGAGESERESGAGESGPSARA